jgi:hypothetical protein
MAPKTTAKHNQVPSTPIILQTTNMVATVLPTSLIVFAYERALVPLYGSGPTTLLLNKAVLAAILLAAIHPFKIHPSRNWLYAALSLSLAPNATYWVAVLTSRRKYPVLGPALTHAVVLVPLMFILATIAVDTDVCLTPTRALQHPCSNLNHITVKKIRRCTQQYVSTSNH